MSNGVQSCNGGLQLSNDVKENDNGDVELVEQFDSYLQDINYRLTVSRVVSDTVIEGMVQEAAEKIAEKELEVTKLKEMLNVYHVGVENEFLASLAMRQESNRLIKQGTKDKMHPSSLEAILEYDRIEQSLSSLRGATKEEFKKLEAEIDSIRGSSVKIISELLGLSDIQQDKVSDRWGIGVDRTLNCLKSAIETGFQRVEQMVRLSKADVHEWQQEQEFKAEIEAFVMRNCIWRFEEKIWDQFYSDKNVNGHGRMKERISGLRQELDAISKSLSVSDFGQLSSHGSLEGDEESNNFKKGDHPYWKVLYDLKSSSPSPATSPPTSTSSASSSSSSWEENGTRDKSEINTEMTELKRNHESKVQDMTEQLFSLMRELLKERGSSLPSKKNKEFDMLRRRISEVISKLDDILVENEQKATFGIDEESLSRLKDRLESLLSENAQLRDLLTDKKREIKCLSLQVSEAAEKMSEHNGESSEAKERLEQDAAAALEKEKERYELAAQELENLRGQLRDLLTDKKREIKCLSLQVSEAAEKMSEHNGESSEAKERLEQDAAAALEKEKERYELAAQELENLRGQLRDLLTDKKREIKCLSLQVSEAAEKMSEHNGESSEAKERLEQDAAAALEKEKERYELAAQELENLRGQLRDLLTDKKREIKCLSLQVSEAAEKMSEHNGESSEAKERLEQDAAAALEKEKERYELAAQELENLRGQLRDLLTDKKREIKCLSLQVSEAAEKMSEHNGESSEAKERLEQDAAAALEKEKERYELAAQELENLRGEIEDLNMESIIMQELVVVIFGEALKDAEQKLNNLDMIYTNEKGLRVSLEMENLEKGKQLEVEVASKEKLNQKIIFLEEAKEGLEQDAAAALEKEKKRYELAAQELENLRGEIEDLNMESIIMQELVVVIFREALKDAEQKLNNLNMTYTSEKGLRVSFEMENLEKGKQLEVEVASKEKLNQKIILLEEAKERLEQDAAAALEKEKKRYELAAQELENLRGESNAHKAYICELGQRLLDVNQEKQNAVSSFEAKERKFKQQLKPIVVYCCRLLRAITDFERRVTRDISGKSLRLKSSRSQLHSLKQKAKVLVKRKILYKRGFERKCSDLEKAEAEVDLLGKEVDTLSSLVEKIYMALDHYSPILQHYAGISEILKLIRRKLRGETKAV